MEKITLNAEYLTTFHTFEQWVNKAKSRISGFHPQERVTCFDKENNTLTCGKDFMVAKDKNLFPVKAYRLIRTSETNSNG